ncbi:hypothetical protein DSECCO2_415670 [anaerobic digester metagenome]
MFIFLVEFLKICVCNCYHAVGNTGVRSAVIAGPGFGVACIIVAFGKSGGYIKPSCNQVAVFGIQPVFLDGFFDGKIALFHLWINVIEVLEETDDVGRVESAGFGVAETLLNVSMRIFSPDLIIEFLGGNR